MVYINMGAYHAASAQCVGRGCVEWVRRYLGDCVCSRLDALSFAFGMISVLCWGVAEVPQIITNFREGCTEGLSLFFLMTWVLGDIFNLVGCYLEPSTLPTQLYMAMLYTITTIILVGQVIYYDHILKWRKARKAQSITHPDELPVAKDEEKEDAKPTERIQTRVPLPPCTSSQPIDYTRSSPSGRELYYMSARSLAISRTPTAGSYLRGGSGGNRAADSLLQHNSLDGTHNSDPIPINISSARSAPPAPTMNSSSSPASILRGVVSVAMFVGGLNVGRGLPRRHHSGGASVQASNIRVFSGRKLFQISDESNDLEGSLGMWFGWMMAVIYMGGRLPQIWLNIKRGSVEGLNPLMFTFALLGNVTYVASILIRSTEWKRIRANMPWLVDAGVCVVLDCFILCQFIYYCTRRGQSEDSSNEAGDYKCLD